MAPKLVLASALVLLALVSIGIAVSSSGCGKTSPYAAGSTTAGWIMSGSRNRTFLVFVPASYSQNTPLPVVIGMHGGGGSATQAQNSFGFNTIASASGIIMLYPDGHGNTWNAGTCCGTAVSQNIDDVLFISNLLDSIEASLCVETAR